MSGFLVMGLYYSGYVMSQSADQGGVRQEKYSKIFALLSENEQGRHFLDALSSDCKPDNEAFLRSRIFALEQQLAFRQVGVGLSGEEEDECQEILADVLLAVEQDAARRKDQQDSLQQIYESLETTANQLRGSGDHSIAGHILADMAARLREITDQNKSCFTAQEETVGRLSQIQKYFGRQDRKNDSADEKGKKKFRGKKFI